MNWKDEYLLLVKVFYKEKSNDFDCVCFVY